MPDDSATSSRWEHFLHGADIGIRGVGPSKARAFEQAALALTGVVTAPDNVLPLHPVSIRCAPADDEPLFLDWINALIAEMSARTMLFSRFEVAFDRDGLKATAWGEAVDRERHSPAAGPKAASSTELTVMLAGSCWVAQCVVDV